MHILIPCYGMRNKKTGQLMMTGAGNYIADMNKEVVQAYIDNCDMETEIIEFEPTLARIIESND